MSSAITISIWPKSFTDRPFVRKLLTRQFWRKAFATVGPHYVQRQVEDCVFNCYLKDGSGPSRYLIKHSKYEPFQTSLIAKNISASGSVIDVGANLGYYSVICSKLTYGTVFAFEPEPHAYAMLALNVSDNQRSNVRALNMAASDAPGTLAFYVNKFNLGDHRAYEHEKNISHKITVDAARIDDMLRGHEHAEQIDVIKIDVQGFEYSVVSGMVETLDKNPNVKIFTEYEPKSLLAAGTEPHKYLAFFFDRGFKAYLINEAEAKISAIDLETLKGIKGGSSNILFQRS